MNLLMLRESEFMLLMVGGHTNKAISEMAGITADKMKKGRTLVLDKMQTASLPEPIVMCPEAGLEAESDG